MGLLGLRDGTGEDCAWATVRLELLLGLWSHSTRIHHTTNSRLLLLLRLSHLARLHLRSTRDLRVQHWLREVQVVQTWQSFDVQATFRRGRRLHFRGAGLRARRAAIELVEARVGRFDIEAD